MRSLLDSFLNSRLWQSYEHDYALNNQYWYLNDPERADRMDEAAKHGNFGITHAEHMDDWTECVNSSDLGPGTKARLYKEIEECRAWHEKNGSLDEIT